MPWGVQKHQEGMNKFSMKNSASRGFLFYFFIGFVPFLENLLFRISENVLFRNIAHPPGQIPVSAPGRYVSNSEVDLIIVIIHRFIDGHIVVLVMYFIV